MFNSDLYVHMCTHTNKNNFTKYLVLYAECHLSVLQNDYFKTVTLCCFYVHICVDYMGGVHGCEYVHLNLWQGPDETLRCSALPSSALVH